MPRWPEDHKPRSATDIKRDSRRRERDRAARRTEALRAILRSSQEPETRRIALEALKG